jgi:N-acetylmuramic acid 6-phosphate etherase
MADLEIVIDVGPEVVAGSTRMKAGTAQKMVLNMITTTALIKLGRVYDGFMVGLKPTNRKLVDRAIRIIVQISGIRPELAGDLLTQCDGNIRLALLMALTETTLSHAREILRNNHGNLREAIKEGSRDEG